MPEMKMLYINITLDIFIIIMFRYLNKYINHRVCFPFFKIKFQLIFLSEIWRLHKIVIYQAYMVAAKSTQLQEILQEVL